MSAHDVSGPLHLSDSEVAQTMRDAGWSGGDLIVVTAVSLAESGGDAHIVNDTPATGDLSYGLLQVNMIGRLAAPRLRLFGIKSPADLLDPKTNAHAGFVLYGLAGRRFTDWTTWRDGAFKHYLQRAVAAIQTLQPTKGGDGYRLTRFLLERSPMQTGPDVKACQLVVGCTPDGEFGPVTSAHVKGWQHAHGGLVVDGIVGPHTARAFGWVWAGPA